MKQGTESNMKPSPFENLVKTQNKPANNTRVYRNYNKSNIVLSVYVSRISIYSIKKIFIAMSFRPRRYFSRLFIKNANPD